MPIIQEYFVYIASNKRRTVLYVGMANNLKKRMHEHKTGKFENAFTKKYNANELIYFEKLDTKQAAAKREKMLKGLLRSKKFDLIKSMNPGLRDLSSMWFNHGIFHSSP